VTQGTRIPASAWRASVSTTRLLRRPAVGHVHLAEAVGLVAAVIEREQIGRTHVGAPGHFAHIARSPGSMTCLCGCVCTRRGTPEEARRAGVCVVCVDLHEGASGSLWPEPRKPRDVQLSLWPSPSDELILALMRETFGLPS
jgi:hypothetical protein